MTSDARHSDATVSVLFVDDEPSVLRVIKRAMIDAPFEILTAFDAAEALTILESRRVDVLVSDIDMPGMDGLALVAVARRRYPTTLRMLLTGQSSLARALDAINEGEVTRFFPKPFNVAMFRETLAALTGRIDRLRREGEELARIDRRTELHRWLDLSAPGTTSVNFGPNGEIVVDVRRVRAGLEACGGEDALRHLRSAHDGRDRPSR